jgi:hypothetical protein
VQDCWREKKKNTEKKEIEKYHQRNGNASEEVERLRAKERWMNAVSERDRDTESKRESKNPDTTESMRKFRSTWRERVQEKKKIMARFRCGNEERENRYWMEGEKRRCRMCCEEREAIENMWIGCSEIRERERKERGEILNEDAREIGCMKEIWKRRDRMG